MLPTTPSRPFGTMLTAMVTPMTETGEVDLEAAVRLARYLVDHGNDGLVLSGTTGEAPTTHAPEKSALISAVAEAVGDRAVVMAGAGSNDTAHAVRMAEQAAAAGADGLLVVSPYYSRPSQEGIYRHVAAIADATDLPVMVYDIPGRTAVRFSATTLDRFAEHDRILAVKDATGDVYAAAKTMERTGLAYYSGDDPLNLALLAHGAAGMVSVVGHVAGEQFAAMARAVDAGDLATARKIFTQVTPAIDAIMGAGLGAVMAKAAMQVVGVLENRAMRLPLVPATDEEVVALRAGLVAADLIPES